MPSADETTYALLTALTAEWELNQADVSVTRRLANAWEQYFEQRRDEESLNGALYYYCHLNGLLQEGDAAVAGKVMNLQKQTIELRIKSIETWLAQGGAFHAEAPVYRDELQTLKMELAELHSKPLPPGPPVKLFVDLAADRDPPPSSGSVGFSAN
jgi:hypothetical protein